ncbi:MAG: N-acetyltransferase [Micrococcales bacterium]|nr:N-acetyltransferase [Micrococcales bacterium]
MGSSAVHLGDIAPSAVVAPSAKVWHHAQVREAATIGEGCVVGRGAYIGIGVHVGKNCKIQNHALVYEPAQLGDGVFVGPAAVLTNDRLPRAVNPDLTLKSASDWDAVGVTVCEGASIGARAVCVAPITIGAWAMIGAGSVVTRDVPAHALVVGVPAKQVGWVSKTGERLVAGATQGEWRCPSTGTRYNEINGALTEVAK